jgi:hypothetical protein
MDYQETKDLIFSPTKFFTTNILILAIALFKKLCKFSTLIFNKIFRFLSQKLGRVE